MGVGGQRHAPAALPPGKAWYPFYIRLGGPQGRSGRVRKISPPPEFDTRPVQPLASRYTGWVISAHFTCNYWKELANERNSRGGSGIDPIGFRGTWIREFQKLCQFAEHTVVFKQIITQWQSTQPAYMYFISVIYFEQTLGYHQALQIL